MSLNGEDMIDLIPADLSEPADSAALRGRALGEPIRRVDPDVLALVEAPPRDGQTRKFVDLYLDGVYTVVQGEKRGSLGLALLMRASLGLTAAPRTKEQSEDDFPLCENDSDNDGIKELYSWTNRVPLEVQLSGGGLDASVTVIVLHSRNRRESSSLVISTRTSGYRRPAP